MLLSIDEHAMYILYISWGVRDAWSWRTLINVMLMNKSIGMYIYMPSCNEFMAKHYPWAMPSVYQIPGNWAATVIHQQRKAETNA